MVNEEIARLVESVKYGYGEVKEKSKRALIKLCKPIFKEWYKICRKYDIESISCWINYRPDIGSITNVVYEESEDSDVLVFKYEGGAYGPGVFDDWIEVKPSEIADTDFLYIKEMEAWNSTKNRIKNSIDNHKMILSKLENKLAVLEQTVPVKRG